MTATEPVYPALRLPVDTVKKLNPDAIIATGELDDPDRSLRNTRRAGHAAAAVAAYARVTGLPDAEPTQLAVGDLLTDLRHFADVAGIDFTEIDIDADGFYRDELAGE